MDKLVYLAMSGAKALTQRQDAVANNLANANTEGFRADLMAFRAVPLRSEQAATTRVYALEATAGFDHQAGPVSQTGRALDVAVRGEGWIAVQGLEGNEAYTRSGHLEVSGEGTLVEGKGPIRTGVTAILPRGRKFDPVFAAYHVLNGNGDMTGTHWIQEGGFLETPILITNTGSVGVVRDAALGHQSRGFAGRSFEPRDRQ